MFFLFPLVALVGTAKLVGGAGNGAAQAIVGGAADNIPPAVISLWGGSVRASVAGGRAYNSLLREIAQAMGGVTPENLEHARVRVSLWASLLSQPLPESPGPLTRQAAEEVASLSPDQLSRLALVRDDALKCGLVPPPLP
jgi:hypothetical protein